MSFFLKGKRFDIIIIITEFMSADAHTSHSTSTSGSDDEKKTRFDVIQGNAAIPLYRGLPSVMEEKKKRE